MAGIPATPIGCGRHACVASSFVLLSLRSVRQFVTNRSHTPGTKHAPRRLIPEMLGKTFSVVGKIGNISQAEVFSKRVFLSRYIRRGEEQTARAKSCVNVPARHGFCLFRNSTEYVKSILYFSYNLLHCWPHQRVLWISGI